MYKHKKCTPMKKLKKVHLMFHNVKKCSCHEDFTLHNTKYCDTYTHTHKKDKRQKMQLMFDNVKKCSCLKDWAKDPTPGT